jgi:hypothetical protein
LDHCSRRRFAADCAERSVVVNSDFTDSDKEKEKEERRRFNRRDFYDGLKGLGEVNEVEGRRWE